jgi:hypothetical protein
MLYAGEFRIQWGKRRGYVRAVLPQAAGITLGRASVPAFGGPRRSPNALASGQLVKSDLDQPLYYGKDHCS